MALRSPVFLREWPLKKILARLSLAILGLVNSGHSTGSSCDITPPERADFKAARARFNGDTISFSLPKHFEPVSEERVKALSSPVSQLKAWISRSAPDAPISETIEIRSLQSPAGQPAATSVFRLAALHGKMYLASCPDNFSFGALPALIREAPDQESYGVVLACGDVHAAKPRRSDISASYMLRGAKDFYVLTWSVIGEPQSQAMLIDRDLWLKRITSLFPLQVCDTQIN